MERAKRSGRTRQLIGGLGVCIALYACELGPSDLVAYSRTAAGPAKIRAVVEEPDYSDSLRADAVVTLLDLQREDVNGEQLAMDSLKRLPADTRQGLLKALLQRLGPRIAADSALTEAAQVRTKDGLSELLLLTEGDVRRRYGTVLIEWYGRAFSPRARSGQHHLDALVDELGAMAAAPLTEALHARLPADELGQLASQLAEIAEGAARKAAGQKLVDIETRWRSDARLTQLQTELRKSAGPGSPPPAAEEGEQAAKQVGATGEPTQAWLRAQANTQRRSEIEQTLLPALGWFADTQTVSDRLLALGTGTEETIVEPQRALALELLQGHTRKAQVGDLLTLATNGERPVALRALALSRAAEHADSGALPQLLAVISTPRQAELRQQAAELVLEIGGGGALSAFFQAMPKGWEMDYSRSELEAYTARMIQIQPTARTLNYLTKKLHAPYWWMRVLGLRYMAQRARFRDLWRIRQHLHDSLQVRGSGFAEGYTVGQAAQAALAVALQRIRAQHARKRAKRRGTGPQATPSN